MAHVFNSAALLQDEIAVALCDQLGLTFESAKPYAEAVVKHLQATRGGTEIYVPTIGREYPVDEIRHAFGRGDSIRSICREYQVDRRTLYRLLGNDFTS